MDNKKGEYFIEAALKIRVSDGWLFTFFSQRFAQLPRLPA